MPWKAWLRSLLAVCLAVHVGAYIVDTGNTGTENEFPRAQNPDLAKKEANRFHSQPKAKQQPVATSTSPSSECILPPGMADEIKSYQKVVDRIIDYVTIGDYKGQAYSDLADLVDTFGPRMTGSDELEGAIDWMVNKSVTEKLDNVRTEDVRVPHWARNEEFAWMTQPRLKRLHIMGLGYSVATPPEGITAEVLVVKTFDELAKEGKKVAGKIVVFNPISENYHVSVQYRKHGASQAAKLGAVAALVRSITPFSFASLHMGATIYKFKKIPVASITLEDAAMMERMQARDQKIAVKLVMGAQTYADTISRNTVVEILGTHQPNETVIVSGHLDNWDVSPGVMDDAGGVMISWAALVVMKKLKLMPKRTVQAVFWTGAETRGNIGPMEYFKRHKHDYKQFQLMMESDSGTFTPHGIAFTGCPEAACIMKAVLKLLHRINTTQVTTPMKEGTQIEMWEKLGVPTASLNNGGIQYHWFHHTQMDTLSIEDPDMLDRCLALWTSVAFVLADIKERLPYNQRHNM